MAHYRASAAYGVEHQVEGGEVLPVAGEEFIAGAVDTEVGAEETVEVRGFAATGGAGLPGRV